MKPFITLLAAATLAATAAQAQNYSAGIRTGIGYNIPQKNSVIWSTEYSNPYSWEKEIFIRRESKKHWAFELGLGHSNSGSNLQSKYRPEEGSGYYRYGHVSFSNYSANLSVQYKIVFNSFNTHPLLSHLKSYVGIKLSPTWVHTRNDYHYEPSVGGSHADEAREIWFFGSVTHTFVYEVSPHLCFSSVAAFSMSGNYFNQYLSLPVDQPRGKIGLQLGAAYKL